MDLSVYKGFRGKMAGNLENGWVKRFLKSPLVWKAEASDAETSKTS